MENFYIVTLAKPFDSEDETVTFCKSNRELSSLLMGIDKDNWKVKCVCTIEGIVIDDFKEFMSKEPDLEFGIN